jgi:hypothetical protein
MRKFRRVPDCLERIRLMARLLNFTAEKLLCFLCNHAQ